MHPLGILESEKIFKHPEGSIRLKLEFILINNCTPQHFILGNDYINIYGIDINNHKDRYFTIGENKGQNVSFYQKEKEITLIRQVKNFNVAKFLFDKLIEAQIIPVLTLEMKENFIEILFEYRDPFSSDNQPLGEIKDHEVDIIHNVERPYPPLLKRKSYLASPRSRESLETHINELTNLGVLKKRIGTMRKWESKPL
ncbi:hypothetical protein O181_098467 [Austropuccinia psidii MF-1]|uniref:Uncharacterized protein n=1 Tax=Austropuccinia psidii MF-1 TaxID=1389203 RepID=A0A9Q3JBA8_9BASI|nr:hypothetical protein [Austropuccinia psidii MF-1]